MYFLFATLLVPVIINVSLAAESSVCRNLPLAKYHCSECFQLHPTCAWCKQDGFQDKDSSKFRCDVRDALLLAGCDGANIVEEASSEEIIDDEAFDLSTITNGPSPIQIKPQKIKLRLRPKEKHELFVSFRQASDYPVDLYYLMDLSLSMADDQLKLSELGAQLSDRMKNITKNFRLGFGSFVEKPIVPFMQPNKILKGTATGSAKPTYDFTHQMKLSSNSSQFASSVQAADISRNLDSPESGLDAMMQSMLCDQIGWRKNSRKMMVYSSDAGFHFAGDGKLAGIIKPNDMKCHLDDTTGEYTEALNLDYPSIGQIHKVLSDHKANVIFAVSKRAKPYYTQLVNALPDVSTSIGLLEHDSRNIIKLVTDEYKKISSKYLMKDDVNPEDKIKITYYADCTGEGVYPDKPTALCESVKVSTEIKYKVVVEVLECTKKRQFDIKIGPAGLPDNFDVDLTVICDCSGNCDATDESAKKCSGHGQYICGVCKCNDGWMGHNCSCNIMSKQASDIQKSCYKNEDMKLAICGGHGRCVCGACECDQKANRQPFTGDYCDCNNYNCPQHNKKLCSGHGTCKCGKCECDEGYKFENCNCRTSTEGCYDQRGIMCNGRGECHCGSCRCSLDPKSGERFTGKYCERRCQSCPSVCTELKSCVLCMHWKKYKNFNDSQQVCEDQCGMHTYIPVDELPELNVTDVGASRCQQIDNDDGCTFYYGWEETPDFNYTIYVVKEKDCPPPVPVLGIVLGVIAGIVLIGLLLLCCWRLFAFLADRAEYARFEQDALLAKWDTGENPIFTPATSTFKNPAYGGKNMQ